MKKFLHVISGILLFLALGAVSGYLLFLGLNGFEPDCCRNIPPRLARVYATAAGGGLFSLLLVHLLSGLRHGGNSELVSFEGSGGPVSISVKAIRDYVERVGDEFAAILSLYPTLTAQGGALLVCLDVRVRAGAHVPELCSLLQERVRETIRENLGLTEIRSVRVNVREIASPDSAPNPEREVEPRPPRY